MRSAVRSLYYFTCGVVGMFPVVVTVMDVFGRPSTVTGNSMRVGVACNACMHRTVRHVLMMPGA